MAQAGPHRFHYTLPSASAWTSGLELFASVMLILIGLFQLIIGLAAVLRGSYYVVTANYVFGFDVGSWGWTHLVLGVLVALTGVALLGGMAWSRVVGMVLAGLSALSNFLFIPYQPAWSLLIIAIDVAVIWALAVHMRQQSAVERTTSE
jgi:hypothetical protein